MIASKVWDDHTPYLNIDIADLAGLHLRDLNKIEVMFLKVLEYNLSISSQEMMLFRGLLPTPA